MATLWSTALKRLAQEERPAPPPREQLESVPQREDTPTTAPRDTAPAPVVYAASAPRR